MRTTKLWRVTYTRNDMSTSSVADRLVAADDHIQAVVAVQKGLEYHILEHNARYPQEKSRSISDYQLQKVELNNDDLLVWEPQEKAQSASE